MKRLSLSAAIALLALTVAAAVAVAATKPVAFIGTYKGTATTTQTDTTIAINAKGAGTGTLIGAGKITGVGTGDSSQRPCIPFTGTGSMKGLKGTVIFKVIAGSSSCGDDAGQFFTFTGKAAVLKATGKLLKAKGTLKFSGTYDRSSGAFSVKFKGSLVK
jgi:hypothetical protein